MFYLPIFVITHRNLPFFVGANISNHLRKNFNCTVTFGHMSFVQVVL
jgi:hypothetical protein